MLKSKDQLEQHVNQFRNTLYQFEKEMDYEFSVNEWRYLLEHGLNSFLSTRKDEQQMISNVSIRTKKRPSRWKLSSGVVYAIPLPRLGGYGYAEMRVSKDENHETGKLESMDYIQYYNLRTETMLSLQELDEKHPDPCIIMDTGYYGITEGEWTVLGKRHREEGTFETPLLFGSVPSLDSDEEYYYITSGIYGERFFVDEEEAQSIINPSATCGDLSAVYKYEKRLKEINNKLK
ncbi:MULTISPECIES: hypothetical protein [Exiguobacterium]|uniref:hypothetical protein n=1 Tax=Exiguobacterium TaxID=33986 RepID=UPI00047A66C3|nr:MULTISPECIES: hypothetical protein [Exiguobacterium]MCT4780602.1 hypothetical protein [Exiguobacterium soli]